MAGIGFNTPLGLTDRERTRGWFVDRVDTLLGTGAPSFDAAVSALHRWRPLDLGWFRVHRPDSTPLERGVLVVYSVRVLRCWFTWSCRITRVIDEVDEAGCRRFGIVWGTVGDHAARGEESFVVRFDPHSGEVRAGIHAVSRPARWYAWLGLPVSRWIQRGFKPQSLAAWAGAVRREHAPKSTGTLETSGG